MRSTHRERTLGRLGTACRISIRTRSQTPLARWGRPTPTQPRFARAGEAQGCGEGDAPEGVGPLEATSGIGGSAPPPHKPRPPPRPLSVCFPATARMRAPGRRWRPPRRGRPAHAAGNGGPLGGLGGLGSPRPPPLGSRNRRGAGVRGARSARLPHPGNRRPVEGRGKEGAAAAATVWRRHSRRVRALAIGLLGFWRPGRAHLTRSAFSRAAVIGGPGQPSCSLCVVRSLSLPLSPLCNSTRQGNQQCWIQY